MTYYLAQRGRQSGPFELQALTNMLAAGHIAPTDLVWTDGMAEWAPVSQMLPPVAASVPLAGPPPPPPPVTPPAAYVQPVIAASVTPTVTNVNMSLNSWVAFKASFSGTFSFSGDSGTQYTVQFGYINTNTSSFTAFGSPVTFTGSVTNEALNISGNTGAGGNWKFVFQRQATGGADVSGNTTALSGTMILGAL